MVLPGTEEKAVAFTIITPVLENQNACYECGFPKKKNEHKHVKSTVFYESIRLNNSFLLCVYSTTFLEKETRLISIFACITHVCIIALQDEKDLTV